MTVPCPMHGLHRVVMMYLSKLYTPALESRLRTQFPHFQYILDNGEMVPTGIDSNTSHQILNLLPKILINPQIIQNPIFITQNIPQRKQIIQTIQKSITFFNFLNIRLTEEKLLIEKEESDGLWSKYVELMSKLGKEIFESTMKCTSWWFHLLTFHVSDLLKMHKTLGKYSNQNIELMHSTLRRSYLNGIQKGSRYGSVELKMMYTRGRIILLMGLFKLLRRRFHTKLRDQRIENFLNLLEELQYSLEESEEMTIKSILSLKLHNISL